MNIEQLERLRADIRCMETTLNEDPTGTEGMRAHINNLERDRLDQLKRLVWERYLEAEG